MAKITYLLGAGASIGALPIVSKMAVRISELKTWLEKQYQDHRIFSRFDVNKAKKFHDVLKDLNWLQGVCDANKNFSVDTYARKLQISGRLDEYYKLKNILSFFFTIEQRRQTPDIRYDNFWASILKAKAKLPEHINVVSWNYDFQLELTFQEFINVDSLQEASDRLNVFSLDENYFDTNPLGFGIYKLNGSATVSAKKSSTSIYWIDEFKRFDINEFIIQSVEMYDKIGQINLYNNLCFAWEHDLQNLFYSNLKSAIAATEILVVIGYSFPFFNRDIDKLVINDFMGKTLKKVYFQAPDAEDLRERFLAINDRIDPNNLVLRKDLKQFTLPNEL